MDSGLAPWIIWAAFGLLLLIVEMFTLSFVMVFFGFAALLVAVLKGTLGLDNLALELVIFAVAGLACLLGLRGKLRESFGKRGGIEIDQAKEIELSAPLAPRGSGKIEYQGAPWDAVNESDAQLAKGAKVVVVRTEGIKIVVRPKGR
jgi:membrane protein implicated in regulation of membrane protease activity